MTAEDTQAIFGNPEEIAVLAQDPTRLAEVLDRVIELKLEELAHEPIKRGSEERLWSELRDELRRGVSGCLLQDGRLEIYFSSLASRQIRLYEGKNPLTSTLRFSPKGSCTSTEIQTEVPNIVIGTP